MGGCKEGGLRADFTRGFDQENREGPPEEVAFKLTIKDAQKAAR